MNRGRRRARRIVIGVLVLAAVLAVVAFVDASRVHDGYGVWALWPGARTPVLHFHDRNYRRNGTLAALPGDAVIGPYQRAGGGRGVRGRRAQSHGDGYRGQCESRGDEETSPGYPGQNDRHRSDLCIEGRLLMDRRL
jgi:hypothetical protein